MTGRGWPRGIGEGLGCGDFLSLAAPGPPGGRALILKEIQVGHFSVRVLVLLAADGRAIDLSPQGGAVTAVENLSLEGIGVDCRDCWFP